ncbi:MAG: hypothetical protein ACRCYR_08335 [Phycicoccus sp.]
MVGLHLAAADTDMMAGWDVPKTTPELVIRKALDGLEAGRMEMLVDDFTEASKSLLSSPPEQVDPTWCRRDVPEPAYPMSSRLKGVRARGERVASTGMTADAWVVEFTRPCA